MKNWLFNSSSGNSTAVARATPTLYLEWSGTRSRKNPAFTSWRTKPCVTRMPVTDSASVAELPSGIMLKKAYPDSIEVLVK